MRARAYQYAPARTNTDRNATSNRPHVGQRSIVMLSLGLFVRLEAKPGKEKEVAAFLSQGLQMANQEKTTPLWFALRLGRSTFAVFDSFHDESGRQGHLNGPIAK